jgi:hypothetical protein
MVHSLLIVGWTGLTIGSFAAAVADIFPAHRILLQHGGGGLLVGSVALMGLAFPFI